MSAGELREARVAKRPPMGKGRRGRVVKNEATEARS